MSPKRPLQRLRGLFGGEPAPEAAPVEPAPPPPPQPPPPARTPPADSSANAAEAARALGIAVSQCAIYGSGHPAALQAVRNALSACSVLLSGGREAEVLLGRQRMTVNGKPIPEADAQQLAQHMERQHCPGFLLKHPLSEKELHAFLVLLGSSQQQIESRGGLAAALDQAGLLSIRCIQPAAIQVPNAAGETRAQPRTRTGDPLTQRGGAASKSHVLDLTAGMTIEEAVQALSESAEDEPDLPTHMQATAVPMTEPDAAQRLERLLRQLQALTQSLGSRAVVTPGAGNVLLRQLRQGVSTAAEDTRARMEQIALGVRNDRPLVEALEAEARTRGVALQFSRNELLARLAEIVQELYQPLTVASGVVDMLLGGSLDAISPNQAEMLKLASESMNLVTQLAGHLKELVGDPADLNPNASFLREAYAAGGSPALSVGPSHPSPPPPP